ncbi:MAG TPA: hypothetical protein ENI39_07400 [Anaerolineae bacterium]|nr:hypothetical protein [Anaerolineae bacterium]
MTAKRTRTEATEPLRIAPSRYGGHWTIEDWKGLDFSTEEGWQRGVDIFEDRISGRFLGIVEAIQGYEFSGFAVMALDCLLIETLQQFYEGKAETPRGQSGKYFRRFLTRTSFSEFFDTKKADVFYSSIRCGILHQAEIKGTSRILIRSGTPLVSWAQDRNGLVINRRLFHQQLECEFRHYVARLRQNDPPDEELRRRFKRKMDAICQIQPEAPRLGILAYGSLIADPGQELKRYIVRRIETRTPFQVEFARSSSGRAGAPTLVPVLDGKDEHVQAYILVLEEAVTEVEACNMLYRREINCVGEKSVTYNDERQREKRNAVVIENLRDFAGLEQVLYTCLPANIALLEDPTATADQKAAELARLARESVTEKTFCSRRDGIRYLADAIRHGIHTPLTDLYKCAVLRLADDAPDLEEARLRIARQKGILPEETR